MALVKRFTPGGNLYPDGTSTFAVLREIFEAQAINRDTVDTTQRAAWEQADTATLNAAKADATTKANNALTGAKNYTDEKVTNVAVDLTGYATETYTDAGDAQTLQDAQGYTDTTFLATPAGQASDAAVDAGVDRAITGGRVLSEVTDTDVAERVAGGAATGGALFSRLREFVVHPSGNTAGSTDVLAINAALLNGNVTIRGGTYYTNAPVRIPSNRTLTIQDATLKLVDGSNCNAVQNFNQNTTGDDNVNLVGIGRAVIDAGNASTQPTASAYNSIGVTFTHVRNLKVRGLDIGPCRGPAMVVQGINKGVIESININHDRTNNNQDGIDVGPSTNDLTIRGITGITEDDGFALFAETSAGFCHAMYKWDGVPATGISNVTISDVSLNVGIHPIRLQAGGGLTLKGVHISNYRNTNTRTSIYGVIIVGPIGGLGVPAAADISDVSLDGYHGTGNVIISVQSNFSNIDVRNVTLTGPWKTFLGTEQASTNFEGTVENVSFDNIKTLENASGPTLLNTFTGTYTNISVTNVNIRRMTNMLNNYGTFTGLYMSNINIQQLSGKLITSNIRETGAVDNVQVSWAPSTSLYTVQPTRLKLGPNMPFIQAADLTPSAATKGSVITCRAGKDPTGGASTTGGQYIANGSTWVKTVDLGANF